MLKKLICIGIAVLALWGLICTAQAEEARGSRSDTPGMPESGLSAQVIEFDSGRRYKVYRGPGEVYGRAGNGKAVVSTNGWIKVFGREGDWIMIRYEIDSRRERIGWIEAKALPQDAVVPNLVWRNERVSIPENFPLTDDPFVSKAQCAEVRGETDMTWLGAMDQWAYVEAEENGKPVRGFMALDRLSVTRDIAILRMHNTLTDFYGCTEDEAADFLLEAVPNDLSGWTATATHRVHPNWRYTLVLDNAGGCCGNLSPFDSTAPLRLGELAVRVLLREADENNWLVEWDRSAQSMQDDISSAMDAADGTPAAAPVSGNLTAEEAVREIFITCCGPEEEWNQALAEWCQAEIDRLADGDGHD